LTSLGLVGHKQGNNLLIVTQKARDFLSSSENRKYTSSDLTENDEGKFLEYVLLKGTVINYSMNEKFMKRVEDGR
jgi:hypothetical protein